jgi:phage shock protein PspC (stress-responsive transcriptional regulator)
MAGNNRKLTRSSADKVVAGVCGGLADWIGWDVTLVRLIYVLISIFSAGFPGFIVYVILWVIMPSDE